jgi:catechol 2,3-dioxygenase-like lactoylglutathione lyase family enzyme
VLAAADLYHVGIVSDDPAATMAWLSEVLGCAWGEPMGGLITVGLPGGDAAMEMRTWYSTTMPRLEVVQSHPGTVWSRADSGLHHFGYWVDDVPATIAALQARGYAFEAAGKRPDGIPYWAYLHAPAEHVRAGGSAGARPAAPRLEIVSRQLQPMMERYFATGKVG